jgi:hypothetical protein
LEFYSKALSGAGFKVTQKIRKYVAGCQTATFLLQSVNLPGNFDFIKLME